MAKYLCIYLKLRTVLNYQVQIQNKLETIFVKPDPINIEQETIKHSNGILKNLYNELKEIYGKGKNNDISLPFAPNGSEMMDANTY